MTVWQDWRDYRRFQKLPSRDRNIVFYSETHQDWHHLQPLIDFLIHPLGRTVCHVTSEPTVPLPRPPAAGLHTFRIRSSVLCTWLFQTLKADVMVLTMLDLHNFQLKRSIHPVHYSTCSTAWAARTWWTTRIPTTTTRACCARARITWRSSAGAKSSRACPPKHIFPYGYPRLERLVEVADAHRKDPSAPPTVLLAPTWGEQSTLHVCGEPLIAALLEAGFRVILRPHYQTARLAPRLVDSLVTRFRAHPQFRHVDRMEESASLFDSDLLISDWSAMAIEYALGFGKPVLFVDVPPRVRNPKYEELGLEPMEMRIRRELGAILPLDRVAEAPSYVAKLVSGGPEFRERCVGLREAWTFNFGRSVEAGAREIARIAAEQEGIGSRGTPIGAARPPGAR
jgi:YidC/Oxa1 family membrane protein insertase